MFLPSVRARLATFAAVATTAAVLMPFTAQAGEVLAPSGHIGIDVAAPSDDAPTGSLVDEAPPAIAPAWNGRTGMAPALAAPSFASVRWAGPGGGSFAHAVDATPAVLHDAAPQGAPAVAGTGAPAAKAAHAGAAAPSLWLLMPAGLLFGVVLRRRLTH